MNDHRKFLFEARVLKLNSHYRPIGVIQPLEAIKNMCGREEFRDGEYVQLEPSMVGLDVGTMQTLPWTEWIKLDPLDEIYYVSTGLRRIRVPTVVIAHNCDIMPERKVPCNSDTVYTLYDNTCIYTGKKLPREELSLDHVFPKSRGGKKEFPNIAPADRKVNAKKGNSTPEEAGLKLLRKLIVPAKAPICKAIIKTYAGKHRDWDMFLK